MGSEKSSHLLTVALIIDQKVHKKENAFELNPLNPENLCLPSVERNPENLCS